MSRHVEEKDKAKSLALHHCAILVIDNFMEFLKGFVGRAPFALLAAVGLLSIVGQFITIEENIHQSLEAWRSVTRPIWEFLLGWLFRWLGFEMPWWTKDYLTLALISVGGGLRAMTSTSSIVPRDVIATVVAGLIWPILWLLVLGSLVFQDKGLDREALAVYLESFVYAAILIAVNYAFVRSGAPAEPPAIPIWV